MMPALEASSRRVCALLTARRSNAEAHSNRRFIQLGSGSDRQTYIQLTSDLRGYVFTPFEINEEGLDRIDWTPGNSPPPGDNSEKCPGKTFHNRALSSAKEINARRTAKGDYQ